MLLIARQVFLRNRIQKQELKQQQEKHRTAKELADAQGEQQALKARVEKLASELQNSKVMLQAEKRKAAGLEAAREELADRVEEERAKLAKLERKHEVTVSTHNLPGLPTISNDLPLTFHEPPSRGLQVHSLVAEQKGRALDAKDAKAKAKALLRQVEATREPTGLASPAAAAAGGGAAAAAAGEASSPADAETDADAARTAAVGEQSDSGTMGDARDGASSTADGSSSVASAAGSGLGEQLADLEGRLADAGAREGRRIVEVQLLVQVMPPPAAPPQPPEGLPKLHRPAKVAQASREIGQLPKAPRSP